MRKALILAALLCGGCSLHMSAELLNPLNRGGKTSPAATVPSPTPEAR
jgi:hypothetical protein